MKTQNVNWEVWATQKEFCGIENASKQNVAMWVKRGNVEVMRWEYSPKQFKTLIKKGSLSVRKYKK